MHTLIKNGIKFNVPYGVLYALKRLGECILIHNDVVIYEGE